jgi:uncharacterized membrane protein
MAEQTRTTRSRKGSQKAAGSKPRRRSSKEEAAAVADEAGQEAPDVDTPNEAEAPRAELESAQQVGQQQAGQLQQQAGQLQEVAPSERTVRDELRSIVREAALEVLGPVARKATTDAAKYAVSQGPRLAKDTVAPKIKDVMGPRIEEAGGAGNLAKNALASVTGSEGVLSKVGEGLLSKVGVGDGADALGTGKGRRLPVQESVDVAVPIENAYNQFTQFEEFPQFMHRVEKVEQRDDTHLVWHEKIWGVNRQWEAEITEQRPNERIAWKSLSGTATTGVVTFHSLSDRLTRIEVNLDFQPHGLFEKTASGLRMSRRALKSDLMRFKAFIETREDETGAWRGAIEEAEVVELPEGEEPEEREPEAEEGEEEPEAEEGEEESEAEEGDEEAEEEAPVATEPAAAESEEEPEPEAEEEKEPEEEKPTRRRRQVRRRAPASPSRRSKARSGRTTRRR